MNHNDMHFAVIVGIDRYPALTDLETARGDSKRFREWLVSPKFGDVPKGNVVTVKASRADALLKQVMPTERQVHEALLEVEHKMNSAVAADAAAWDRTRLYIFVAGHGILPNGGGGALVMADASPELLGYHIDLRKYVDWYRINALFREVVVFADFCRVVADNVDACGPPFTTRQTERKSSTVLGYASMPNGTALGDLSVRGGLFTEALLDALSGGAADENGEITYDALEDCVQDYLAADAVSINGPLQKPDFDATGRTCIIARISHTRRRRAIRLLFKTEFSGVARLIHGDGHEELFRVDETVVQMSLLPGLYKVEPVTDRTVPFRDGGGFRVFTDRGSGDVEL